MIEIPSMYSVESRSPLLDYRLHKFLFTVTAASTKGLEQARVAQVFDQLATSNLVVESEIRIPLRWKASYS